MRKVLVTVLFVLALVTPNRAQTVYQKDRWGTAVYYFDFAPSRWQLACVVLM